MSDEHDPKRQLSFADIEAEGLADWRLLYSTLHARFKTGDFANGLELVNRIGAVAEAANHHPDVDLSYPPRRDSVYVVTQNRPVASALSGGRGR